MNQVERKSSNSSSKGNSEKTAVLPTQNSPKKGQSTQARQGGNPKSSESDSQAKSKRSATPRNGAAQGDRQSNDKSKR